MKTRKILSVVMAVMMLFGCLGMSSYAIDWPQELEAGAVTLKGLTAVSSVEFEVSADYTAVEADAEFTVYYSEEKAEDAFDYLALEEVGKLGVGDVYLAGNVLHVNLAGLKLSTEGYYYIGVSTGALTGTDCQNIAATTEGALYQFESLDVSAKITAIFDYVISLIMNLISNGKSY